MAVYKFLAFKDLYIQTNLRNKFLKKLYKTMNSDLHIQTSRNIQTISITQMLTWEIVSSLFKDPNHVLIV